MAKRPQSIRQVLNADEELRRLHQNISQQQHLANQVKDSLPGQVAQHCHVISLDGNSLRIVTDSSLWAAKIRFSEPQLLASIRRKYPQVRDLQIATRPIAITKPLRVAQRAIPQFSAKATQHVENAAKSVSNEPLKHAMQRLAKTLGKLTD
jgi:hypothetical protein